MDKLGFRINPSSSVASPDIIDALRNVVTPHLSDNMRRMIGVRGLRRYHGLGKLVGTALTVKTRPGDNLMVYKALTMLSPGHVLVIDGHGDLNNALIGELIMQYAEQRGCAGFVVNGAIRDVAAFQKSSLPCYALGHVHCGPYKEGPGEINVPVSIGGQVVCPGDIVVGDEDGLVSFPPEYAVDLLEMAKTHAAYEEEVAAEIATGNPNQHWLNKTLQAKGL